MVNAFDMPMVKELKREIAENNKSMEALRTEIEDILNTANPRAFTIGRHKYKLVETKAIVGNTSTWRLELCDQKGEMMIRNSINNIAALANDAEPKTRNIIFYALDRIITRSCDYIEVQVKLGAGDLFGSMDKSLLEARQAEITSDLNTNIQQINKFCLSEGLAVLSDLDPEEFAWEIASEYFQTRAK